MYCPNGHQNRDDANFCRICGVPLSKPKKKSSKAPLGILVIVVAVIAGVLVSQSLDKPKKEPTVEAPPAAPAAPVIPATEAPEYTVPEITFPEITMAPTQPEGYIEYVSGSWESVYLEDGTHQLSVHAFTFDQTLVRCKKMTIYMEVEMNAGTKCYDWNVWVRRNGVFEKYTQIRLPNGDGTVESTITFSNPMTIDSIIVTPTVAGGYSWSMSLGVYDVYLDK